MLGNLYSVGTLREIVLGVNRTNIHRSISIESPTGDRRRGIQHRLTGPKSRNRKLGMHSHSEIIPGIGICCIVCQILGFGDYLQDWVCGVLGEYSAHKAEGVGVYLSVGERSIAVVGVPASDIGGSFDVDGSYAGIHE